MSEERLKALEIAMELFGISRSPRIAATEWINTRKIKTFLNVDV